MRGQSIRRRKRRLRAAQQLAEAAANVRFLLHCELASWPLGGRIDAALAAGNRDLADELCQRQMGQELASEAMAELQAALTAWHGEGRVPPICKGCSPLDPWETGSE